MFKESLNNHKTTSNVQNCAFQKLCTGVSYNQMFKNHFLSLNTKAYQKENAGNNFKLSSINCK